MKMSGAFTKVLPRQCEGNTPGLPYISKKGCEMKPYQAAAVGENSSDFTNKQSPQDGALSGDLLDQKSKSPLFLGAGGGHGYN